MLPGKNIHKITLQCILGFLLCSCSVTRNIPQGEYLLKDNIIKTEQDLPSSEKISHSELETYIRQTPNKKILGINLPILIYSWANPQKDNWGNRLLRRIGEAPVILDSLDIKRSVSNLKTYMNSIGYLSSSADFQLDTLKKKAKVIYKVTQNEPYRIGSISYDYQDKFIESVINEDSSSTLIRSGNIFNTHILDNERQRISQYLKNNGYYDFSVSNISYLADSLAGENTINITMVVRQNITGYNQDGTPIYENNSISRINKIFLVPDYNPTQLVSNLDIANSLDTLSYKGLDIVYNKNLKVRPKVLREIINIDPNSLYNTESINQTYSKLINNDYFNSASILFQRDTLATSNIVSYVGETLAEDEATENTTENYLNCTILAIPSLRQSYNIELEASTTSNYYGLTATVGYQNRNLFRGMEIFDISASGGYDFMKDENTRSSFEIGGATSLSFPRFILPFDINNSSLNNPRTKVELSINKQYRTYYNRTLSSVSWAYSWNNGKFNNYTLRPIDISLIRMSYIDQDFLDGLTNPYLENSYISQLVAGISGSYVYNNQSRNPNGNSLIMRLNLETTGNLISGLAHLLSNPVAGEDYYNILSIRFAQYVRAEFSLTNKIVFSPDVSLVYRFWAGAGLSYGNSESLPFDKLFFCGGSNGMRGWAARTLGPGNETYVESDYPNQLGNMKLEANLEARFPVWGILKGAAFFDLGNIWFMSSEDSSNPESVFHFNSFYKQLGFNTGLGARLDFGFFLVRIDWGVKLHDPNVAQGNRWISDLQLRNTSFNFGVGYPF